MAELMKRLSEAHAVSGCENSVRRLIIDEIREKADEITVDTMGNIIALKQGAKRGRTIAVTAHMDEAGLIISGMTDKGYLKFKLVGDIDPRKLVSKKVVTQSGVMGVIGMKAIHLQTADERENVVKVKNLFIDIGAKDKEDAEKRVKLGEYVTFDTDFAHIGKNVKGKALERSGVCFALINALDGDYPYDFYALFTAQHEVGSRGAQIASHRIDADAVLTISACDTADMYGCGEQGLKIGGGVGVSYMDKAVIPDRELTNFMLDEAKKRGIMVQTGVTAPYESDTFAPQLTGARVVNAVIPCRYAISPVSVMSADDIDNTTEFIKLFLNKIGDSVKE